MANEQGTSDQAAISSNAPKISFGFTRKIQSKVVEVSKVEDEVVNEEITHMENGLINGQKKPKKKEPVIQRLGQQNDWRIERLQKAMNDGTATEEQKALLALLREGLNDLPQSSNGSGNDALELKPQENGDAEADDVDPDYDQISLADFGAAFLRGRGWKKGEGIGRTNKRVVPLVIHAKGKTFDLGLKKKKTDDSEEQEIPLGPDSAVKILYGKLEGKYARILTIDSASGRCDVKLPDGSTHEIMDKVLQTISDKEYLEKTKVLNKSEVDKYKKSSEEKKLSTKLERRLSIAEDDNEIQVIKDTQPPWPVSDLLVRIVDKKFKDGRYYKDKMLVVDAPSKSHVELKDDRGRIHTLNQSSLETVIPRGIGGQVMILKGREKGRVGVVVDRDDKQYLLKVRVLGLKDLVRVDFDDACEYRGNVEEMDYD